MKKKCIALIVAAGKGHRFGNELPKQYHQLGNKMVLAQSLGIFANHYLVDGVAAVINFDDMPFYEIAAQGLNLLPPIKGGKTRQDSVRLGLEAIKEQQPDIVLIHDGARPFISYDLITNTIEALNDYDGVIPAIPVKDTLKKVQNNIITQTVDRNELWRAQTPQGFNFEKIRTAHLKAQNLELTDDAAVFEYSGLDVLIINGDEGNEKITLKEDLEKFNIGKENSRDTKIGSGFDVHQICNDKKMYLCGVEIDCPFGLKGHSDADVALHALADALFGAVGAGDIGLHFPPSDDKWQGAASEIFVKKAVATISAMGGTINNIDLTIICEKPKISNYRLAMLKKLSEITGLSPSNISLKATTTEKLGFTGRGEGIAAQAVAAIKI
ncbi:MAG: bifunctional 2-C-methyl-D-erythritol 4-phosphate cytidylyltransferase/2-C-methyl-D-erythritol 2,4-cyclodiphosphate synthase [Alphaproteobacteria bacterium]